MSLAVAAPRAPAWAENEAVRLAAGLTAILLVSAHVRTRAVGAAFWGDEAISVGVASHPLSALPGLLREDGSPPLYYVLLHVWMRAFGDSEAATHALSVVCALACVPLALWLGRALFGPRAGWAGAALAALNPLLSTYAQETRMYALVALLSLLVSGTFVAVFVQRRRGLRPLLAAALAALLYTHGWGIFLVAAAACAAGALTVSAPDRRAMALDAGLVFGAAGAVFAPWVPTLLFQAAHTGAPWARIPGPRALSRAVQDVVAGPGPLCALVVAGGAALWRAPARDRRAAATLVVLGAGTLLVAWGYAQHTRAWSPRYFIVLVGPVLLLGALCVARARVAGLVALAVVSLVWFGLPAYATLARKSNIRTVAPALEAHLRPGDLIVAAQPDTGTLLRYVLGPRYRYATPLGLTPDPTVMDWRDAVARLRAAGTRRVLALARALRPGARLAYVRPVTLSGFRAPWTRLVKQRAAQIGRALARDDGLQRVATIHPGEPGTRSTLRGVVYRRV
jgi:hypothetical protein